jgi:outer membrane protein TolC
LLAFLRQVRPQRLASSQFRQALVIVLLLPSAGCAVGPNFVSPLAPVANKYLEARNHSIGTGGQDYRAWWKVFHDPALDRLIEIAYAQNLTLLSAGTKVLQARAELGIAVGDFYPQTQRGIGLLTYNRPSHADGAANPQVLIPQIPITNFWRSELGFQAAWELDFWGRFRRLRPMTTCS